MFTKKASSTVDPSFWPSKRAFRFRPAGAVKELWRGCSPGSGGEIQGPLGRGLEEKQER